LQGILEPRINKLILKSMKNKTKRRNDFPIAMLLDRYEIFDDGCIYDTIEGKDIPQHIFKIRDILIENA
jgi:hypothetical protein